MDVHRCRFVPYPSSAINALAFSHPSFLEAKTKPPPNLRLAIGRANGDIEIWNPLKGSWSQESVLRGGKDRSVEGLAWIKDPDDLDKKGYKVPGNLRLFSIGYSQAVTEWDLAAGKPLRHSSGNHAEIWCLAAQPKSSSPTRKPTMTEDDYAKLENEAQTQAIAVGCADGSIVLLSTDEADLRFNKVLARPSKKKTRVLSLAFQNRHSIIAGHADSTIRIYDMRGSQQVRQMTLGAGPKGGPKETLVWAVKSLRDGTIVSGDSNGTISFWDGKHYALLQRIKGHDADILDLAVGVDGKSVFSGGMDRRTVLYRKTEGGSSREKPGWSKFFHQRLHQNDVKAMATFETKGMSILASGGLDTNPIIVPIQEFGREYHRTLPSLPQQPALVSAPNSRLLVSWWEREVSIWSLSHSPQQIEQETWNGGSQQCDGRKLVAKVALHGDESITSADISRSGDILVVATIAEIKFFRLRSRKGVLKVQKLPSSKIWSRSGAKTVHLSPDRRWLLAVRPLDIIHVLRIVEKETSKLGLEILSNIVKLKRISRPPTSQTHIHGSLGSYDRSINNVAFSSDSRILAVGDLSGRVDTWLLEGHENLDQMEEAVNGAGPSSAPSSSDSESDSDSEAHPNIVLGQHWIPNPSAPLIPKLSSSPLHLSFRPSNVPSSSPLPNGTPTVHPTRNNPHPHSHSLPRGEARLLAITSDNFIRELDVLKGGLSEWSRRNPPSCFPPEYRNIKDRAKGVIWDTLKSNERVWVYGVNWLWMFDLSQDLPLSKPHQDTKPPFPNEDQLTQSTHSKRKRKRPPLLSTTSDHADNEHASQPYHNTGAGDRIRPSELSSGGIGHRILKIDGTNHTDKELLSLDNRPHLASDSDDEMEDVGSAEQQTALIRMRRGEEDVMLSPLPVPQLENGDGQSASEDSNDNESRNKENLRTGRKEKGGRRPPPPYWHTYKYRPILGIVPLGPSTTAASEGKSGSMSQINGDNVITSIEGKGKGENKQAGKEGTGTATAMGMGIEVALVERPLWEMEHLPPRYVGGQEWGV